jgi:hypothetical protein
MRVLFQLLHTLAQKVGASNVDMPDIAQVPSSRVGIDEQFFVHTDGPAV